MPQGTLKGNKKGDAYVHYEFVTVKCNKCGVESNPFVYKDHLEADDMIQYIYDITGFAENRLNSDTEIGYSAFSRRSDEGGLICPMCNEIKLKEVSNV